jgi:hypothetical protein
MADDNEELFGDDEDQAVDDFNRLSDLLFLRISEFSEQEDVADELLPLMLLRLAVTMRMMNYVVSVDKPSGFGLKLDLDRFRRDAEDLFREMKKESDDFIAQAKETIASASQDEEGDET